MSPTGGNRNDVPQLLPPLDKVAAVASVVGRPRRRPDMLFGVSARTSKRSVSGAPAGPTSMVLAGLH